jgi:hypothetical protein
MKGFDLLLGLTGAIALLVITVLIWLIRERVKFKKEWQALTNNISQNNRDIMGLYSAAITIDARLAEHESTLNSIQAKIAEFKQAEPAAHPYRSAIQKVQGGAGVAEVMQNFGLSRDEAALLIRLHGHKTEYE